MSVNNRTSEIRKQLQTYLEEGKRLCITSSFQTHSLPLLHICSRAVPEIPVLFIDTGYHFPETYAFRDRLVNEWDLNLQNLQSNISKEQQRDTEGHFLYHNNPTYCCHLNKVIPLENALTSYDIWVAGLRRDQTSYRSGLEEFEEQSSGVLKYHPILDWNAKMIYEYRKEHQLPEHPLEKEGYLSVGCVPCTQKALDSAMRTGRWMGSKKTECGIHLNAES